MGYALDELRRALGRMPDATFDALVTLPAFWRKDADDALATTATAESAFWTAPARCRTRRAFYVPDSALTADNTNYASIILAKQSTDGGTQTILKTLTTQITGSGDWTAFVNVNLGIQEVLIEKNESLTIEITKAAAGVVVPAGYLHVELVPEN